MDNGEVGGLFGAGCPLNDVYWRVVRGVRGDDDGLLGFGGF